MGQSTSPGKQQKKTKISRINDKIFDDSITNHLKLNAPLSLLLSLSETIRPIRIPQRGEIINVGTDLTVSGWGVTESSTTIVDDLLYTVVNAISNLQCAAVFGSSVVVTSTVCTQGNPFDSPCTVSISFGTLKLATALDFCRVTVVVLWCLIMVRNQLW